MQSSTIAQSKPRLSKFSAVLLSLVVLTVPTACTVFGGESVEEASFELVRKDKQFEIRDYAPMVAVETRVDAGFKKAGNTAFRKLFRYISGSNEASQKIAMTAPVIAESDGEKSGEKIAMTAPVLAEKEGDEWRYQFVLPKSFTIDTAPKPTDPDVYLVAVEQKRVATLRYAGRMTDKARIRNTAKLISWMEAEGLVAESVPRTAGYNAPWTLPPFRRNEVLIDISVK